MKRSSRLIGFLILCVLLTSIFVAYSGHLFIFTLMSSILASVVVIISLYRESEIPLPSVRGFIYLILLFAKFIWIELQEHIKMARIILSKDLTVNPSIVSLPIKLRSDTSIALLSYILTNTPGTIVVDIDKDQKIMYVHWLFTHTDDPLKAKEAIVNGFEDYLERAFG